MTGRSTGDFPLAPELERTLLILLSKREFGLNTAQILQETARAHSLSAENLRVKRGDGRYEFRYRLAWVRTKAKNKGLIERTSNSVWRITNHGLKILEELEQI